MKIKVTMVLDIEAGSLEEAEEIYYEWDDRQFLENTTEAVVTIEEV